MAVGSLLLGAACLPAQAQIGSSTPVRIGVAGTSGKSTTTGMIAWLLHRRAMIAGDPGAGPNDSAARIGKPVAADWDICDQLATGEAEQRHHAVEPAGDQQHLPGRIDGHRNRVPIDREGPGHRGDA